MSSHAPLQMIRADIRVRAFQRWMGSRRLQDADHAMHCLLTECFGELAPKPFRAIFPRDGGGGRDDDGAANKGTLYGYGTADVDALRDAAAAFACPLQSQIIPADGLDGKLMPAEWPAGKRLGFEVRIRPTRRLKRLSGATERPGTAERRRTVERDAFLMQALDDTRKTRNRQAVYEEWLRERLQKCGAAGLESATLQSFQRSRAYRKRNAAHIEGPDALMRGELMVADGAAFANLLQQGIGRHRAYGYGMLLLRPAGSSIRR